LLGVAYKLEFADVVEPDDVEFESHGVKVLIDAKSLPYLDGTELDYAREGLNEGCLQVQQPERQGRLRLRRELRLFGLPRVLRRCSAGANGGSATSSFAALLDDQHDYAIQAADRVRRLMFLEKLLPRSTTRWPRSKNDRSRRQPKRTSNQPQDLHFFMALLQIAEPGESEAPHQHRLAVGIDLGTTNSLVATVRSGLAVVLSDDARAARCCPRSSATSPTARRGWLRGAGGQAR
jgi:hypothetical protein